MDRGQRGVVGEGTLTDRGHRVGECGGGERGGVEGVVADLGQAIQVRTEIHLGEGLVVAEGTIGQHRGTTQVNALQLGHVPEGRVIHRLEGVRQGQGRDPRPHERTLANVTQMRGQGHGGDLRRGESTLVDECGFLGNGVRAARVLRLRVCRQVRQALRVQDAVKALVALVRSVNLDTLQERGACECREEAVSLDVWADGDGAQLRHVAEGLEACRLERTRQGNALQGRVCEGALPDRLQLRGVCVVVLEGHLGERLARKDIVADCVHARGDPHARQTRAIKGVRSDLGDTVGDADIRCSARVRHEHAVGVDGEAISVGVQRGGCVHPTGGAGVCREGGGHADHGQGQGAGERERQHR